MVCILPRPGSGSSRGCDLHSQGRALLAIGVDSAGAAVDDLARLNCGIIESRIVQGANGAGECDSAAGGRVK